MTLTDEQAMTVAIHALIDAGSLSPGARDMRPADALHQWAEANAMTGGPESAHTVTVRSRGRTIRADYHGGPYVDLTFGTAAHPSEVLNVWDYRAGRPFIANTPESVRGAVMVWVDDMDADPEWPEWFDVYEANA